MTEQVLQLDCVMLYRDKYPLPTITTNQFMQELEDMELRKDDIFVVTYPKSGTHWMQEIVNLILVNGRVEKLSSVNRTLVIELADVKTSSPEAVAKSGPVLRQVKDAPSPRVLSTHVPFTLLPKQLRPKQSKLIYVYRHPKDTIVSNYNFRRKVQEMRAGVPISHSPQQFELFFEAIVSGKFQYGSWFDHVIGYYQRRQDDNVFAVSYEEMKTNLKAVVEKVSSFIGRYLDEDALRRVIEGASFQTMKQSYEKDHFRNLKLGKNVFDANIFINKGQSNQWKDYFTAKQEKIVDDLLRSKMANYKAKFEYSFRKVQDTFYIDDANGDLVRYPKTYNNFDTA